MATGYTYAVAEGKITTLRDFALTCARGMGALIMMRDEPMDAPIPEMLPVDTSYDDARIAKARAILAEVPKLSDAEADERAAAEYEAALAEHLRFVERENASHARLKAMREQVLNWTTGAEGLREFMLQQLDVSIGRGAYPPEAPVRQTAEDWRATTLANASDGLARAEESKADERRRTADRQRWLDALRASLPAEAPVTVGGE